MEKTSFEKNISMPVQFLKGVGEKRAEQLARLGIETVADLLVTLPKRYEDRRSFSRLRGLNSGDWVTTRGTVRGAGWQEPRYGRGFFEVVIEDGTAVALCRWFGARYLKDSLKPGEDVIIYGKVSRTRGQLLFQHPEFEPVSGDTEGSLHIGRLVPVYGLTENLPQKTMRRIVFNAVEQFADMARESLPAELLKRRGFPGIQTALHQAHFPERLEAAELARARLVFEEFLCIQLILAGRKAKMERSVKGLAIASKGAAVTKLLTSLSFELTDAQIRVLREIRADLARTTPMHRLLQGDVGSGKTLVALCAMLDTIESGAQAAVMAPTEILAEQHFRTINQFLEPFDIQTDILTGDKQAPQKRNTLSGIKSGRVNLVVGTHALIQDQVEFHKLGLVVIDEQHKFGVEQRGSLYGKGDHPHVLVMTATPIPRTLAMTVYGDLDTSIIDELPKGRQEIVTRVIKESQLADAYDFVKKQVAKGRQAYLVYPLVSESDQLELRSAEEMYAQLNQTVFRNLELGLLHGQLPSVEKNAVMTRFRNGDVDVLVATTVVEVGVDVANANVMVIENAERFGLAQLHQLRGRIGRGAHKSYCVLQGDAKSKDSWKRLRIMAKTTDGFRIAEEDLEIRGMGNIMGREQSGFPKLRVADPLKDGEMLRIAREEAFRIIGQDPELKDPAYAVLKARARALYKEVGSFVQVG